MGLIWLPAPTRWASMSLNESNRHTLAPGSEFVTTGPRWSRPHLAPLMSLAARPTVRLAVEQRRTLQFMAIIQPLAFQSMIHVSLLVPFAFRRRRKLSPAAQEFVAGALAET